MFVQLSFYLVHYILKVKVEVSGEPCYIFLPSGIVLVEMFRQPQYERREEVVARQPLLQLLTAIAEPKCEENNVCVKKSARGVAYSNSKQEVLRNARGIAHEFDLDKHEETGMTSIWDQQKPKHKENTPNEMVREKGGACMEAIPTMASGLFKKPTEVVKLSEDTEMKVLSRPAVGVKVLEKSWSKSTAVAAGFGYLEPETCSKVVSYLMFKILKL